MLQIQLEKFEGPLGLLLHLIRKSEMDIYDIQIHKITQQYLEYIQVMKDLNLEVAGDFVSMAATLIHIKSKMLLPQYDAEGDVLESEDPRKELVQRLIEYQRYQEVAQRMSQLPLLGKELWPRGVKEHIVGDDSEIIVEEGGLFALVSHYKRAMQKAQRRVHVVFRKTQSLASRVMEMRHLFILGGRLQMSDLLVPFEKTRAKVVITFLSLLELSKLGFVSVFQNENYESIYVDVKKQIQGDIVTQLQEYENIPLTDETQMVVELEPLAMTVPEVAATDADIDSMEEQLGFSEPRSDMEIHNLYNDDKPKEVDV